MLKAYVATVRLNQAGEHFQQLRFARTRRAKQDQALRLALEGHIQGELVVFA
jgi:hypothetical protein